jgi:hypothetical protein
MNKTNRCTEFQFYWYYDSTCFGQPFCLSSGVLSRTSALVHFMQLWLPFATRSRMELQNSWWWAERLPETCRVLLPTKLEFSASVGFVHTESVTIHGHTIVKLSETIRIHAMKVRWSSRCLAALNLIVNTSWRWVVSITPRWLYPSEITPVCLQ